MHCVTMGYRRDQFQKVLLTLSRDTNTRTLISRATPHRGHTWDLFPDIFFARSPQLIQESPYPSLPTPTTSPPPALLLLLCYFRIKSAI